MHEAKISERPIAMDIWTLAGAAQALMTHDEHADPPAPSYNSGPDDQGYHFELLDPHHFDRVVGELRFIRHPDFTLVRVRVLEDFYPYCANMVEFLDRLTSFAQILRQRYTISAEGAIERYYRSRAAGSRKTLRQIATETAYSYDYLRKVKRQYDADGKWGSKKGT